MPNVAPRGLFGAAFQPVEAPTSFGDAEEVYACLVAPTWLPAQTVWAWDAVTGAWQVLWAVHADSPEEVFNVQENSGSTIGARISWNPLSAFFEPGYRVADRFIIKREPDFSTVGEVAWDQSLLDLDPRPRPDGLVRYQVTGVLGGVAYPSATASYDLFLGAPPPATSAVFDPTSPGRVILTIGAIPSTSNGVAAYRPGETTPFYVGTPIGGQISDLDPIPGGTGQYRVCGVVNGRLVNRCNLFANLNVPPDPPFPQVLQPRAGVKHTMDLYYVGPADQRVPVPSYGIQTWENGVWTDRGTQPAGIGLFTYGATTSTFARVRSVAASGAVSDWVQIGPAQPITVLPPSPPASVAWGPRGDPCWLRLTFAHPGGEPITCWRIQTRPTGAFWPGEGGGGGIGTGGIDHGCGFTGGLFDYYYCGTVDMRVRSEGPGGVSAWVTRTATPAFDTTGPGPATGVSVAPESSYGRMVVRGNWPADGDLNQGQIWFNYGGGWVLSWQGSTAGAQGAPFQWAHPTNASAGQLVQALVRTFDVWGNQSPDVIVSYGPLIPAVVEVNPTDGATSRAGAYRSDSAGNGTQIWQGLDSVGENAGWFFYGDTLRSYVTGRTVVGMTFEFSRKSTGGLNVCQQIGLWVHASLTKGGAPPGIAGGPHLTPCANLGAGILYNVPPQLISALQSGYRGFAVYRVPTGAAGTAGAYLVNLVNAGAPGGGGYLTGRVFVATLG